MFRLAVERAIGWWQEHTDDILGWDLESLDAEPLDQLDTQGAGELLSHPGNYEVELLGALLEPATYYGKSRAVADRAERFRVHPHRASLGVARKRRPGSIPPRPAHCISPVRSDRSASTTASFSAPEAH
jgi:hypothetical protein